MEVVRKRLVFPGRSRLDETLRARGWHDVADELELARRRPDIVATGQTGRGGGGGTAVTPLSEVDLTALGILTQTFHLYEQTSSTTYNTGDLIASVVPLRKGQIVSRIHCWLNGAAVGVAPTLLKFGLLDLAGNVLAATADNSANAQWLSTGLKEVALTGAFTITADGDYYLAWLRTGAFGTTGEQLAVLPAGYFNQKRRSTATFFPAARQTGQADMVGPFALVQNVFAAPWLAAS